ncbi:MAG TPA: PAS domain S-box protein [Acidimicrobiia bacterium]|nr:PAS domain S-box protein [Acidimicrobiia bacterium]
MDSTPLDDTPLGLALCGLDGRLVDVNGVFAAIAGRTREELRARDYLEIVHPDDRSSEHGVLSDLASGGVNRLRRQVRFVRPDGEERIVSTTVSRAAGPPSTGGVVIRRVVDVTGRAGSGGSVQEDERFRRAFEEDPLGVAFIDQGLRLSHVNAALARMLGRAAEALDGRTLHDVTHPGDVDLDAGLARRLFAREIPGYEVEKRFVRGDGECMWGRMRLCVMSGTPAGEPDGLLVVEDITEAKEAEATRRELDDLKDGFLRVVSHDLQGPLAVIAQLAEHHSRNPPATSEEERRIFDRIGAQAERLRRTVATFLDVDRLYQGGARALRRPVSLGALVDGVIQDLNRTDHPLTVEVLGGPAAVDGPQVEHILENLLDNAFRHTPAGSPVWVRVACEPEAVSITVEDAGPGVGDEMKRSVFELFRTGAGVRASTGIGLWVVKRFAELHGGSAWVEDRPGGGASFRVVLLTADPV